MDAALFGACSDEGGLACEAVVVPHFLPLSQPPFMPRLIYYFGLYWMIPLLVVYKYQDILRDLVASLDCLAAVIGVSSW